MCEIFVDDKAIAMKSCNVYEEYASFFNKNNEIFVLLKSKEMGGNYSHYIKRVT